MTSYAWQFSGKDGLDSQDRPLYTSNGKPGNMYNNLGGTEQERSANLTVIKDWVGGWTLKRKKDISADELKAIKALEK